MSKIENRLYCDFKVALHTLSDFLRWYVKKYEATVMIPFVGDIKVRHSVGKKKVGVLKDWKSVRGCFDLSREETFEGLLVELDFAGRQVVYSELEESGWTHDKIVEYLDSYQGSPRMGEERRFYSGSAFMGQVYDIPHVLIGQVYPWQVSNNFRIKQLKGTN